MGEMAHEALLERVSQLDSPETPGPSLSEPWERLIWTMGSYTNFATSGSIDQLSISPETADEIVHASTLLQRLGRDEPGSILGPLRRSAQVWVGTGRHGPSSQEPSRQFFVKPDRSDRQFDAIPTFGIFTSSAVGKDGRSMWQLYLSQYPGSDLFPYPWKSWSMPVMAGVKIYEVTSALSWVEFVERYPHRVGSVVHPDWIAAAVDYDGVHVTMQAVVAAQSWYLRTSDSNLVTAPRYWDVESTFWLRWAFRSPSFLEQKGRQVD